MKKFFILLFLMAIGTSAFAQSCANDRGYLDGGGSGYSFVSVDGVLLIKYYERYYSTLVKFPQNKNVTTYTIPETTRTIAKGAFKGNKYIQTLRIPSSIMYIGDNAFDGCENLKTIEIYESGNSLDSSIQAVEMDEDIEKKEIGRYNINGVKVEEKDGGIQIILYSDGSAEKVLEQP